MLDPASLIVFHTAMMWSCAVAFLLIQKVETGWDFPGHWPLAFALMPMVMLIGGYAEQTDSDGLRVLGFAAGFIGPALLADGVRLFLRLPIRPRVWTVSFGLFSAGILLFTLLLPSLLGRLLVFQIFTAGIGVYGLALSRRLSREDHPLGRRFIGTFGIVPILAVTVQVGLLLTGQGETPGPDDVTLLVLVATAIGVIAAIGCIILVAERFAAQIGREARSDVLTGLATRRVFDRAIDRAVQRHSEQTAPVCVILFDIDHFKSINDTHGHDAGDSALRAVADCARSIVRPADLLARLGGDEFAILLPDTKLTDATEIAHRVLERLRNLRLGEAETPIRLSGSFGVSCAEGAAETPQTLLKRADLALYEVKRRGRNDVKAFGLTGSAALA